ncbi:MAG: hypothetical protein WBA57_17380 [Elainellaceae cyanobacterium]
MPRWVMSWRVMSWRSPTDNQRRAVGAFSRTPLWKITGHKMPRWVWVMWWRSPTDNLDFGLAILDFGLFKSGKRQV